MQIKWVVPAIRLLTRFMEADMNLLQQQNAHHLDSFMIISASPTLLQLIDLHSSLATTLRRIWPGVSSLLEDSVGKPVLCVEVFHGCRHLFCIDKSPVTSFQSGKYYDCMAGAG